MPVTKISKTIWKCDRCGKEVEGTDRKPSTMNDAWSWLKIDQDSGWDASGACWCPRMKDPVILCGRCTEDVIAVLNTVPPKVDSAG